MENDMKKKMIVVWFSCGAASAVAAKKTIEKYGSTHIIRIVNNPVKEEHHDNTRFLADVEKWLGVEIEFATNPKFPNNSIVDVFNKSKYMSGILGAPCTVELKKEARKIWENKNKPDFHVLGFTFDEKKRFERFVKFERSNTIGVLIDEEITKDDCFEILISNNIQLPESYRIGMPNANCIGCVKATSATYWSLIKSAFPDVFAERAEQSRKIGCKLARFKGKRMFLDELPDGAKGNSLKTMNIDCGIFCEEKQKKG